MTSAAILSQALAHLPAIFFLVAVIYASYWIVGMAPWPQLAWRKRFLENVSVDVEAQRGFSMGALIGISLASLFLELLLVRWIASEIRVFAYFKSLPLIASFLGFGLGCYLTRRKMCLAYALVPLASMILIVELPWAALRHLVVNLSAFIGWFSDVHLWGRAYFEGNYLWGLISAALAVVVVITLFGLIAITFVPFGQLVGWYLEKSPKGIAGYSVNVLASVIGIWLYTLLCFLSTPPVIWFGLLGVGLTAFFWGLPRLRNFAAVWLAAALLLFAAGEYSPHWWGEESWKGSRPDIYSEKPGVPMVVWSPYQKLTIVPLLNDGKAKRFVLNTNDSWYQEVSNLNPEEVQRHPELNELDVPLEFHRYNLPYRFYENPPNVLIAGAGMGNDVAASLRNGAGHVTAVEIDPLIFENGKKMHPEQPYDSPRVTVHVDDARAFVQRTHDKYDLVVYSILDSHTTSSHYTNIRLDNYVYTLEAMQRTRELLKPDGVFALSFSSERPWFAGRLREIVTQAFGKPPLMVLDGHQFYIVGNGDRIEKTLAASPKLKQFVDSRPTIPIAPAEVSTDDWPYLYQQTRAIPTVVWLLSIGLTLICWLTFRRFNTSGEGIQWHFFFLGAAFMLLEVQIISKAALLFGTTWLVNSIIISSLLMFILLANLVISSMPNFPMPVAYAGLFLSLAASYLIPANALFFDSMLTRGAAAAALYCSPVFFAGLIFVTSFREAGFRAEAFGSNLVGSLVGGLLESISYLIGIKALVLVAALLYLASAFTSRRTRATVRTPAPAASYSS
jgi:SAM-dependent methyltransferase